MADAEAAYFSAHKAALEAAMVAAVTGTMEERPDNPLDGLIDQLKRHSVATRGPSVSVEEMRTRQDKHASYTLDYGPLSVLRGGLMQLIGLPAREVGGSVLYAMEREHCGGADAELPFSSQNGIHGEATENCTSSQEFEFVVAPKDGVAYPQIPRGADAERRVAVPLSSFVPKIDALNEILASRSERKVAARRSPSRVARHARATVAASPTGAHRRDRGASALHRPAVDQVLTVPAEIHGHAALDREARGALQDQRLRDDVARAQLGHHEVGAALHGAQPRYTHRDARTHLPYLHLHASPRQTKTVYRGAPGGRLPSTFWEADELGLRGGVNYGTVSTTYSREMALSFAHRRANHAPPMARPCRRVDDAWSRRNRSQPSTLFELTMGLDSRGCEVDEFSQYPWCRCHHHHKGSSLFQKRSRCRHFRPQRR